MHRTERKEIRENRVERISEAAKNGIFLVARPLREGGGKALVVRQLSSDKPLALQPHRTLFHGKLSRIQTNYADAKATNRAS